jgi:hypothetical protein
MKTGKYYAAMRNRFVTWVRALSACADARQDAGRSILPTPGFLLTLDAHDARNPCRLARKTPAPDGDDDRLDRSYRSAWRCDATLSARSQMAAGINRSCNAPLGKAAPTCIRRLGE